MGVTCQILIKSPKEGKHIIGQSIIGKVKYKITRPTEYRKISLSLIGIGKCEWMQKKRKNLKKCEGIEKYILEKVLVDNNRINPILNIGTYVHPFNIVLPLNLPPSVRTEVCEIYYYIVLKFERASSNKLTKKFGSQNITIYPSIPASIPGQPITFGLDKILMNLFDFKKEHVVHLKGKLDNEYLTLKRDGKLDFLVTNDSDTAVSIKTELVSKVVYTDGSGRSKTEEAIVKEMKTPKVPENSVANLFNVISIWSDLFTVRSSKIMSREYKLRVTLKLPMPHTNVAIEIPVVIGERHNQEDVTEDPPSYWEVMYEDHSND